ncbi:hypothetical protein [Parvularcula sp. IMCC14364]|uniref:hypothetical protein n=1 Tax=Parvularcula sp. IMCC14364 TaxID=3067902 RepID=UPI00274242EE|nr:hypothetical protein [Parvularcula sp. IMCC14364]
MKKILTIVGFFAVTGFARLFLAGVAGSFLLFSGGSTSVSTPKAPPKTIQVNADTPARDCDTFLDNVPEQTDNTVTVYRPGNDAQRRAALLHHGCKTGD